jgi:SAM-dependent methyltransferase
LTPVTEPAPTTEQLKFDQPNAARMYDYYLGGAQNTAADRALAERVLAAAPQVVPSARANRAFLQRAVRYCVGQGVRQFLDLGSGIPTVGHVHEVAHHLDPTTRVAYVDNEQVAVAATRRIIEGVEHVTVTQADLRDPEAVFAAPGVADLLDLTKPVAVLAVAVLHFVPDGDEPGSILAAYRDRLAGGGYLVLSHLTADHEDRETIERVTALYRGSSHPGYPRSHVQVSALLPADVEVVEPGVVTVGDWRPEPSAPGARMAHYYAAVARVR